MKEKLEAKGWKMYYECKSPCPHKQYFTHTDKKGYEVRVSVKKSTFSILKDNLIIGGPFWSYMLEEKLNKYVQ